MKNQLLKIALFVGIPAILFAASARIKDFGTTATTVNNDDYVPIDGATSGTRKILASYLFGDAATGSPLSQFAATTSAQLAGVISNETGSGLLVFDTAPTFPGNITITGNATPATTTAGALSFNTNAWAASRGSFQAYDGTANIVLLGTLASDTPTNGQVPTWNTGGTITWENAGSGLGNVTNNATLASGNLLIGGGTSVVSTTNIVVTGGNNISLGAVNATNANVTAFGGATANGQLLIGDISGPFVKAVPTGGAGVNIVAGPGSLAINSTDARNFIVNGVTITTNSTGNITFVEGSGVTLLGNNTTKNITVSSSGGGGNGTLSAGIGALWPTAGIASPPTGFFEAGLYGTTAQSAVGSWSIIVASGGTVATPTVDVAPGAVASGTVVTFSSATSGLTNFRSTTNGTDPSYTVGTAGNSVTVTANNTYEVVANKQGWITSPVGSFAYTITAGIPTPDLLHWPLNGPPGTTITASVGPGSTTNTGTLNNDFLAMAVGNGTFQSSANVTYSTNIVTLALWLRVPNLTNYAPILRSQYINDLPRWELALDGGWLRGSVIGATGFRTESIYAPIGTATWGHVAVVFNNSTAAGDVKLYINGALAAPDITNDDKTGTANFAAGLISVKSIFADNVAFDLDDVRLYAGELTSGQISAIHAAGRP
jgi:hypothetical protein